MDRETRKFLTMIAIVAVCVLVFFLTPIRTTFSRDRVAEWSEWIAGLGFAAPVLLIALLAVTAVVGIPRMYPTIVIGALFSIPGATAISIAGSTLGAVGGFLFARFMGRAFVERRVGHRFSRLLATLRDHGFAVVAFLRIVPFTNFAATNYLCGVSSIRLADYTGATALGMIPSTLTFVLLGRGLGLHDLRLVVSAAALLVIFTAVAVVGYRRFFARATPRTSKRTPDGQESEEEARQAPTEAPASPAAARGGSQAGG
jgi:uncharacterized membrane protein YdjX (TVP38/TMEM64 family)